jgi:hypothetical protein
LGRMEMQRSESQRETEVAEEQQEPEVKRVEERRSNRGIAGQEKRPRTSWRGLQRSSGKGR